MTPLTYGIHISSPIYDLTYGIYSSSPVHDLSELELDAQLDEPWISKDGVCYPGLYSARKKAKKCYIHIRSSAFDKMKMANDFKCRPYRKTIKYRLQSHTSRKKLASYLNPMRSCC
jgi:hypothetical protein